MLGVKIDFGIESRGDVTLVRDSVKVSVGDHGLADIGGELCNLGSEVVHECSAGPSAS